MILFVSLFICIKYLFYPQQNLFASPFVDIVQVNKCAPVLFNFLFPVGRHL